MIKFGIMAMPQHPRTDSPVTRFRETDAGFEIFARTGDIYQLFYE